MRNKNKINIFISKFFRIFFSIGIVLVVIVSIINDEELYIPITLILVGSIMVWFIGRRIKAMEGSNDS